MKTLRTTLYWIAGVLVMLALLGLVAAALAQTGESYDLSWWTVDGGGGHHVGVGPPNPYTLDGTVGQPDAGVWDDGGYMLVGGFWYGGPGGVAPYRVYLPLVLRGQ